MRNDQIFVLLLVILMPLSGCIGNSEDNQIDSEDNQINFQPENRDELKTAVDEWVDDSDNANSTYGEINTWNTSLITNMSGLFLINWIVSIDISDWDVSSVTDMSRMFEYSHWLNSNISDWDVSSVTNMSHMFYHATVFNSNISDWDVSGVTDMSGMFESAEEFQSGHFRMGCFRCN